MVNILNIQKLAKHKQKVFFALLLSLGLFGLPLSAVMAADGTGGNIQASAQIFHVSGSPISINMFDLDVDSAYRLNWTGDAAGIFINTSSIQTKFTHTFVLTSSASLVRFTLRASAAGTEIDAVQVTVVNLSSFLSTGLIISAGIFILIIVIFKRVAKG